MLERDGSVEHEVNEYNYRNFKLPMLLRPIERTTILICNQGTATRRIFQKDSN